MVKQKIIGLKDFFWRKKMIGKLKMIYRKEQFNPKIVGLIVNPFYFARKGLYESISQLISNLHGKLLDIGCGTKPYKDIFSVDEYIGLEIADGANRNNKHADVFYDGKKFPFSDKTFDSILISQVFEHVFNPEEFLQEVNRVTKMGGMLLMTVPFVWDEHEQPYDYARYTSFGLKYILGKYGFEIIEHKKSCNGIELVFQLINSYFYKKNIIKGFKHILKPNYDVYINISYQFIGFNFVKNISKK